MSLLFEREIIMLKQITTTNTTNNKSIGCIDCFSIV